MSLPLMRFILLINGPNQHFTSYQSFTFQGSSQLVIIHFTFNHSLDEILNPISKHSDWDHYNETNKELHENATVGGQRYQRKA
jgi:hypothetical protein